MLVVLLRLILLLQAHLSAPFLPSHRAKVAALQLGNRAQFPRWRGRHAADGMGEGPIIPIYSLQEGCLQQEIGWDFSSNQFFTIMPATCSVLPSGTGRMALSNHASK